MHSLKPLTKKYTFTASGEVSIATLLDMPAATWVGFIALRAGRANSADIFWRDEHGSPGGYIGPGEAVTIDFGIGQALAQNISLAGTSSDIVYATIGVNRAYFNKTDDLI